MKRALLLGLALGFALALATGPGIAIARPPGEFPLLLRLNGQPYHGGVAAPFADAGVTADIDAGLGQVVQVNCNAVTLQAVGVVVTPANGIQVPANESRFYVFDDSTRWMSVRNVDAGAAACPWWIMR